MFGVQAQTQDPFLTVWKTDNPGTSNPDQITLPIRSESGASHDFWVYWGDGSYNRITSGSAPERTHTYPAAGTYTVRIEGARLRGWAFYNAGDREKILWVSHWGRLFRVQPPSFVPGAFYGCSNLRVSAGDVLRMDGVSGITSFFHNCASLDSVPNIGKWDVSAFASLFRVFSGCPNFDGDLSDWNVGKVSNFSYSFSGANKFNNGGNPGIANWNTGKGTDFPSMFYACEAFNQPIGSWDVSKATSLNSMFRSCKVFNRDLGAWNVGNVTSFSYLFIYCDAFNNGGSPSINNWDTSKATSLTRVFRECGFNQPVGNWNIANVTDLSYAFYDTDFDQDLGAWNVGKVATALAMFTFVTLSTPNYDSLLIGWAALPSLVPGVVFHAGFSKYTKAPSPAATARAAILATYGWTITDGGPTP